jgi:hypothetical protein
VYKQRDGPKSKSERALQSQEADQWEREAASLSR